MWNYIVGALLVACTFIAYILYRGYNKVKPKPLEGIPVPPLTHPLLGHPDKMLHPLKHELRLEVCEAASEKTPLHQLVLMKHSSVFVNDACEAARVLNTLPSKGSIYATFRFDSNTPDMLASDVGAWSMRRESLGPALKSLSLSAEDSAKMTAALLKRLGEACETSEVVNLQTLLTLYAFDYVCMGAFKYWMGALGGSEEGKQLVDSLNTLVDVSASSGVYASPTARKVSPEEMQAAKDNWRAFLKKVVGLVNDYDGGADGTLMASIKKLSSDPDNKYGDYEILCEVHQFFRHGQECIAGTLVWIFYALQRNPRIRARLEAELAADVTNNGYLECVIKEALRRYPVTGNLTVRTVSKEDFRLKGGHLAPVGTPIHMHMWSLQNTARVWDKPKEFIPERWEQTAEGGSSSSSAAARPAPKCPFLAASTSAYDGLGHTPNSLSFFPFSAGARACPAKDFALDGIRKCIQDVVVNYRFLPTSVIFEEDPGSSLNAAIIPMLKSSTSVTVSKATELGKIVEQKKEAEEGWADDEAIDKKEK